jgi:hypothetical protein
MAFDGEYVATGFADERDEKTGKPKLRSEQSEIYLRVVKSDDGEGTLPLSFKDRGDLAGGVAHPTMDVIAISRQLGPINGGQTAPALSRPMTAADTPMPADAEAKPTAGILPVLERINRFKDSINIVPKGRFLGIMDLSDLIQKFLGVNLHPKLNEIIEYAAASAGGAASGTLTEVRSLLTKALIAPAEKAVDEVEKTWVKLAKQRLKGVNIPTLADVYPQIGTDIDGLHQLLRDAQSPSTDDISFFAELAAIHEAARRLGRSIDNIARDPLAAAATAQLDIFRELSRPIDEVREAINELKALDFSTKLYEQLASAAKALVVAKLLDLAHVVDKDAPLVAIIERAGDAAWPKTVPTIKEMADLPSAIVKALETERDRFDTGDVNWASLDDLAHKELQKRIGELQPVVNAAVKAVAELRKELGAKLERAEPKLRQRILELQDDIERAERRALQSLVEILLTRPVVTALMAAIEIRATFGDKLFTPPFDQEKLTALLKIAAPELKAIAALGGATYDASKLFMAGLQLCEQVKAALTAGVNAVLPKRDACEKLKTALTTQAEKVDAGADGSPADKAEFKTAVAQVKGAIDALTGMKEKLTTTISKWANGNCELPPKDFGEEFREPARKLRLLASAFMRLVDATANLIEGQLKDISKPSIVLTMHDEIDLLKIIFGDANGLSPPGALDQAGTVFDDFAAKLNILKGAIPSFPLTAKALERLAQDQLALDDVKIQARDLARALEQLKQVEKDVGIGAATWDRVAAQIKATRQEFLLQQELIFRRTEQALTAELFDLIAPTVAAARDQATKLLQPFGKEILEPLARVLETAVKQRDALNNLIKDKEKSSDVVKRILDTLAGDIVGPGRTREDLFLVEPNVDRTSDALLQEQTLAQSARDKWPTDQAQALLSLSQLADAWRRPALVVLVQRFNGLSTAFLRALLVEALDLRALRRELDRIVRELIPSKAILGYTLSTPVRRFGLPGIGDIFLPVKGTQLDIRMQAIIDLQNPKAPDARVDGRMGPFGIQLFGSFDVVTLNFHGLEFRSGGGRTSGFDVRFGDFKIGSKAKFLKQLEPYVSPKGGLPPVRMMRDKPGIEASYGINLGSFGVGYLSFSNVSLNAGARLPFGAREEAEFLISIGRQDAPFLISSTVFGGGGYLALLANGKGFIGLECSFDYGGVFAFGFGPLTGAGQITLGMYFRAARGSPARLGMNFMARGAANIACFSICAALFVRLTYSGGKMDGQASYTFSFSIGIDDIDFTFDVYINQGGSAGSGSPTSAFLDLPGMPALTQFAGAQPELFDAYAFDGPVPKPSGCKLKGPELSVKTPSSKANWKSYHALFDSSLDPIVKV